MLKTLFVDDERLIREGISNLIDWKLITGQELMLAENGDAALEYLENNDCDIVITDIYMQDINGIELAKCIKEKWPSVIVILLSAYEDFEYAQKAIEVGVFKYLLKPVIPEELEEAVQEAILQVQINLEMQNRIDHSQKILEDYKRELERNLWKDLLYGNIRNLDEITERVKKINMQNVSSIIYTVVYEASDESAFFRHQEELERIIESCFHGYIAVIFMGNQMVIILNEKNLKSTLYAFRDLAKEILNVNLFMGEGSSINDLLMLQSSVEFAKYSIQKEKEDSKDSATQIVLESIKMIQEGINNVDFSINTIAKSLYLTPAYFSRIFKKKMGMTCIDFIKNYRINLAKELLQNTDLSIQQISEKTGYATVYYFSQQFKQATGESPGNFRKRRRNADV